jgi:hypothetical protein
VRTVPEFIKPESVFAAFRDKRSVLGNTERWRAVSLLDGCSIESRKIEITSKLAAEGAFTGKRTKSSNIMRF